MKRITFYERVTIDNSLTSRKYGRYGTNLLEFVYGIEEQWADLTTLMAQESKHYWADTTWREIHTGHLHKAKGMMPMNDEYNGARFRTLPALCPPDAYHSRKGYVGSQRAAEAYLWSFTSGYAGHFEQHSGEWRW